MEYKIQTKTYYNIYDLLLQNKNSEHSLYLKKIKKKIPTSEKLDSLKEKLNNFLPDNEQSKIFELGSLIPLKDLKDLTEDIILSVQKTL